jgi:hypothetical protein
MDGNVALAGPVFYLLSGVVGYIYLLLTLGACKRDNNRGKFRLFSACLKTIRMLLTMKKLLSVSSSKILLLCGLGLLVTLGSFWHLQVNQSQMNKMNVLNQGVGTCFNRISQTFTALMIRDIQSPYLNRGFMGLSDECLNETIKGINPFRQHVGKGYETLNKLISDVHWFHEAVTRIHSPMVAGKELNAPLNPISTRFSQMETLKVNLVDEIDMTNARIREVQANDELLMGAGLLMFVIALSLLALKEFNRIQLQREIENQALNLLKAGQANVGAMVDQLVEKGLMTMGLPVSAQIFRDYHGELLERSSHRQAYKEITRAPEVEVAAEEKAEDFQVPETYTGQKTSLKEILVSIQNINSKDLIHASDVRDVQMAVSFESFEQMFNAAINKLASRRNDNKKIMISNQIHSDRSVINLFLAGNAFTASELDFSQNHQGVSADSMDMNMIILKEMAIETNTTWMMENKTDKNGMITGMSIRFTVNRAPKESKTKNLVSVVRGKKKDLAREMMN